MTVAPTAVPADAARPSTTVDVRAGRTTRVDVTPDASRLGTIVRVYPFTKIGARITDVAFRKTEQTVPAVRERQHVRGGIPFPHSLATVFEC